MKKFRSVMGALLLLIAIRCGCSIGTQETNMSVFTLFFFAAVCCISAVILLRDNEDDNKKKPVEPARF